jgi:hypothetical protein
VDISKLNWPLVIEKFDEVLSRGLCTGVGKPDGQMCIEAAICYSLDLPFGDDPECVARSVRAFKIRLNDSNWSSPEARAKGLRELGIAQIGSRGVVDEKEFAKRLSEQTVRQIIPALFREVFPGNKELLEAALRCENEGTRVAADAAALAAHAADATASAADAADAAAWAADATASAADAADAATDATASAADAADAAAWAASAADAATDATKEDKYLILSATIALQILKDMKSPGCKWL